MSEQSELASLRARLLTLEQALEDAIQVARHYSMLFHDETWKARQTKWEAALAASRGREPERT